MARAAENPLPISVQKELMLQINQKLYEKGTISAALYESAKLQIVSIKA